MQRKISIDVIAGDVLSFQTDVLVLKYAQHNYGIDEIVSDFLVDGGCDRLELSPRPDEFRIVDSKNGIDAKKILIMGVVELYQFEYRQIRDFARNALSILAQNDSNIESIAFTLHGANYGLDENEAFASEIAGIIDAIESENYPHALSRISIVERNNGRAERLKILLNNLLPTDWNARKELNAQARISNSEALRAVGYDSASKAHVFVAMPFHEKMDDVYHYGIQAAVRSAGYLCERADLSSFTGDVLQWVKDRISTAKLVIADLSDSNPNVYLEVGYAWGKSIPVVLLVNDAQNLKFDVKGQRCLTYKRIKDLEQILTKELNNLK